MDNIDSILGENLRIMAQAMTEICQRSTLEQASPHHLTRNQFTILKILSNGGIFQISYLAKVLDISNPAVSKNIDRLAKLGLVARHPSTEDRRRLEILLLPPGLEIVTNYDRIILEKLRHLMEQFTPEEKLALLDMVKRVTRFTLASEQDIEAICLQCGSNCGESGVIEYRQGLFVLADDTPILGQPAGAEQKGSDPGPDQKN